MVGRAAARVAIALVVLAGAIVGTGSPAGAREDPVPISELGPIIATLIGNGISAPNLAYVLGGFIPRHDPFYDAPALTAADVPGTVLKVQPVTAQFIVLRPRVDAWRLMYVTRDLTRGGDNRVVATGILFLPRDGRPNAERPLIGYQEANDSLGSYCGPSNQWVGRDFLDDSLRSAAGPLMMMLNRGAAVMMSDDGNDGSPPPHSPFAGLQGGPALLDGLRAALRVPGVGLDPHTPIGLFGIAGGGVHSGFAAELAPTYARELNLKAQVLEGMVTDPEHFVARADGGIGSGFAFADILGLGVAYPRMNVQAHLSPLGATVATSYRRGCQTPWYFLMPYVPLSALFTAADPATNPDFRDAFAQNRLDGHVGTPRVATMISSCTSDSSPLNLIATKDILALIATYRGRGVDVSFEPTSCRIADFLTRLYRSGTDLFGMQQVGWLVGQLSR